MSDLHNTYFRPRERLLSTELVGTDAFREATGLGRKWLAIMQDWGVITHGARDREEYQRLRDTPRRRKSRRPSAHPG